MWWFLRKPWSVSAAVAGAILLGAAGTPVSEAGFTAVKQPKRRSDPSHEQILERVYGGDFVSDSSGLNFSSDSGVTVTRLDDTEAAGAASTDEIWNARILSARAVAAFGRGKRMAGYFATGTNGQLSKLFDAAGRKFDVSGACDSATSVDGELCFARGRKANRMFSSVAASNRDGTDHLVSYQVQTPGGDEGAATYLLCWEDRLGKRSDRDYNDMVIELKTTPTLAGAAATAAAAISEPLLIPLPPALWSGLGGLVGLGVFGAVRRSKRRTPR